MGPTSQILPRNTNFSKSSENALRVSLIRALLLAKDEDIGVTFGSDEIGGNEQVDWRAILTCYNVDEKNQKNGKSEKSEKNENTVGAKNSLGSVTKRYGWSDRLFQAFLFCLVVCDGIEGVQRFEQDIRSAKQQLGEVDRGLCVLYFASFSFLLYRVCKLDCGTRTA